MSHSVYVFDAYGTLFDVHAAVRKHADAIGPDAATLSDIWRQKQLEYSWVRGLTGKYMDFWSLTEQALDFAFAKTPSANPATRADLLHAYETLDAYPEVAGILKDLKDAGAQTAILSNGSPKMLESAVTSAGLDNLLDNVLSVDELRVFKTDQRTYDMVTTAFRVFPDAVSFQSSNRWDIAGATQFGFRTVWINRTNQPDEYSDLAPAAVLSSLENLPSI